MYIIDMYNKYGHNKDVVQTIRINGLDICIRKITEFEWGQPVFPDKNIEDEFTTYHIYEKVEDARKYIRSLRYYANVEV